MGPVRRIPISLCNLSLQCFHGVTEQGDYLGPPLGDCPPDDLQVHTKVCVDQDISQARHDAPGDLRKTRPKVIRALEMLANKREVLPPKKHGSIPL